MKSRWWRIIFAAFLLGISALFYVIHYFIFRDSYHIFYYLILDVAFIPISVLLVTLILEHILTSKQKEDTKHKLNMVVGIFYSEVGNDLLRYFNCFKTDNPGIIEHLQIQSDWTQGSFLKIKNTLKKYPYTTDAQKINLDELKDFLASKRTFLLSLLENPNLLEHNKITDLLWAIFHLTEELTVRDNLKNCGKKDLEHLSLDIKRAYNQIVFEWLNYMQHLKKDYPYLYSLAVRTNPFNPDTKPEIV